MQEALMTNVIVGEFIGQEGDAMNGLLDEMRKPFSMIIKLIRMVGEM